MVDFYNQRNDVKYIFRRVAFPELTEIEDIKNIESGSLEWSAFTDLKVSAKLSFVGPVDIDKSDMVRIYYHFKDVKGNVYEKALATLKMVIPDTDIDDVNRYGNIECDSILQVLASREYGMPFTVSAGTKAIDKAVTLCESLGLHTNNPKSDYVIKSDYTFDYNASYLEIVNWLCDMAGYAGANCDAMGNVVFERYVEPIERDVVVTFADDERSIMYPKVKHEYALVDTPNVVRAFYESDTESLYATAANNDAISDISTVSRKYEKTKSIKVSELDADTQDARIKLLCDIAKQELISCMSGVEHVKISHAWLPISTSDAVMINYTHAGFSWKGTITDMSISLDPAAKCNTKLRNFVRQDVTLDVEGGAL